MSEDMKPTNSKSDALSDFRWGVSASAGAGIATRSDGNKTAVGPQMELAIGPYVHWDKNSLTPSFFTHVLYLNTPLFGQTDPIWVKTFGAKVNYGRDLTQSLTFRGQLGLGLAVYGPFSQFSGQNGVYTRETFVGPHFELGAGLCFFQEKFCALVSYNYDVSAYTRRTTDYRSEFPIYSSDSKDAHGMSLLLSFDLGKL